MIDMLGLFAFKSHAAIIEHAANTCPTICIASFRDDVIGLGPGETTNDLNMDDVNADYISFIQINSLARKVLFGRNKQVCISTVIGNKYFDGDTSSLLRVIVDILLEGLSNLGINNAEYVTENIGGTGQPICFLTSAKGDILGSKGKIISTTRGHYPHAYVLDANIILDTSVLNVSRYLNKSFEGPPASCLEDELGRELTAEEVANAFISAYDNTLGLNKGNLTYREKETYLQNVIHHLDTAEYPIRY